MNLLAHHGQNIGACEEVDQSQTVIDRYSSTSYLLGQTFVAGITGELKAIEVQDDSGITADFTVRLNDPDGAILYTDTITLAGSMQKTKILINPAINIVSGQSYYFEIDGGVGNLIDLALEETGAIYTDGQAYNQSGSLPAIDLTFWTYVCPFNGIDSPSDITSLREWWNPFDASSMILTGSRVDQIDNQVTTRHLTPPVGEEPTWNNDGSIFFDASTRQEYLQNASFAHTAHELSIYVVCSKDANSGVYSLYTSSNNYIYGFVSGATVLTQRDPSLGFRGISLGDVGTSTKTILHHRISDLSVKAGYDQSGTTDSDQNTTDFTSSSPNMNNIYVGTQYVGGSFFNMDGYIYDFLVWDKYTSDSEHAQIIEYLKHKHSIA